MPLMDGVLNFVQEEMDSRRILALRRLPFAWDGRRIAICADQCGIARTHRGVLYASGSAVVIIRSTEPQMQRASMFFLKLFGYRSC
jgi:hypothetical protein